MKSIKILRFQKTIVTSITKDTPNLSKYGASLQEIEVIAYESGLALQKCDRNLYALIHVPSGHTLNMRSMHTEQAFQWFNTALNVMKWDVPVETIIEDERIKEVLELGEQLEAAYMSPSEEEKAWAIYQSESIDPRAKES